MYYLFYLMLNILFGQCAVVIESESALDTVLTF